MISHLQRAGAFYSPGNSEFIVWAPLRDKMELIIGPADASLRDFDGFPDSGDEAPVPNGAGTAAIYPMAKDEWGYWKVAVKAAAGSRYLYRPGEGKSYPDPASVSQPDGVHGSSELWDGSGFVWEDESWKGLPLSNMVIYEIHTGAFSATHDFEGVIRRLDDLSDLGVNALELMPVVEFAGDRNWGYDGVFPFAVQSSYGGPAGLMKLVNAAHSKGMAVILDTVYNHLGPEGNILTVFGPYLTDSYKTPWGSAINFDDAWSDGVRSYFIQNAQRWLEEFHIDGLRLDAVHAVRDFSAKHFIKELRWRVSESERRAGCRKALIAELDLNDTRYIDPPEKGGYGLDGVWNDEFHHALHALLTGERTGYYEDFGSMADLKKVFEHIYVYNGIYSPHRKKTFGSVADGHPYHQFVVFSQNHDHIGNRPGGDRLANSLSFEQLKLAAAAVLLSPFVPLLFMGEEYGERNPFLYFTSHTDSDLIEAVRKGREQEHGMGREAGEEGAVPGIPPPAHNDPQSPGTYERSQLSWRPEGDTPNVLREFYKFLIRLRHQRPALQGRLRNSLKLCQTDDSLLVFEREIPGDCLLAVLNFSDRVRSYRPGQPEGESAAFHLLLDSSSPAWGGPSKAAVPDSIRNSIRRGESILLQPHSVLLFEKK